MKTDAYRRDFCILGQVGGAETVLQKKKVCVFSETLSLCRRILRRAKCELAGRLSPVKSEHEKSGKGQRVKPGQALVLQVCSLSLMLTVSSKLDTIQLCGGDSLCLPLFYIFPFALGDKRKNLQHQISNKSTH